MADRASLISRRRALALLGASALLSACASAVRWDSQAPARHTVKRGETLYSIAFRYGKSAEDLARWNALGDGSLIFPGQVLRLSPSGAAKPTRGRASGGSEARSTARRPLPRLPDQPAPAWGWPTSGRIDVGFGGKPGPGTGVLINGRLEQPVVASAAGRVVYAGSGLIGYGQLIIIKHNETYLSAYGYTRSLLVREGQSIRQGQRIATMGEGPERKPRLHFEIRRNGEPVDPVRFLPAR